MGFLDRFRKPQNEHRSTPPTSVERIVAVNFCVESFKDRDWDTCMLRAAVLARDHVSLQAMQMLLISAQRMQHDSEDERDKSIWNNAVMLAHRMQGMDLIMVRLTLGEVTLEDALRSATTKNDFCKAYYYAGARSLSLGYVREAISTLKKAVAQGASTWEVDLAAADLAWAESLRKL